MTRAVTIAIEVWCCRGASAVAAAAGGSGDRV